MTSPHQLKPSLGPFQIWALAVGLVISGEYFGWSYGWGVSGTYGFLISTLLMAFFFTVFVLTLTELSCALPSAGGPFTYAQKTLGNFWGKLTALFTLIEFTFAPPAIAFALGGYLHVIIPSLSSEQWALISLGLFGLINLLGIQTSAKVEVVLTILAVLELIIFIWVLKDYFKWSNFSHNGFQHGIKGISASLPFAIWFFLGIEGVALVSEEVRHPQKNLPRGLITGIITLVVLAIGVMLVAGGVGDWTLLSQTDYPIPLAVKMALGENHPGVKLFAGIGLFGLLASLNGIMIGASRQFYAVARKAILPYQLCATNRFSSPYLSVIIVTLLGFVGLLSGHTGTLITISAIGAVSMYFMCMVSYFQFKIKDPHHYRPFKVPFYPALPLCALIMSFLSLLVMMYFNLEVSLIFIGIIITGMVIMKLTELFINRKLMENQNENIQTVESQIL
jgi:ethanolamine permease